jgi:hypothetical protein
MGIGLRVLCHFSQGIPTPPHYWTFRPVSYSKMLGLLKLKREFDHISKYHPTKAYKELGTGIRIYKNSGDWLDTQVAAPLWK